MASLSSDPIIVLGAPRSGTTYLRAILDSHPEVVLSNEVRLLEWMNRALTQADDERALFEQREDFLAFLRTELPDLVRRYYESMAPQARWWGDKNPHYAESAETLGTIADLFPAARFVHIVRDPRAVLASLLQKFHADGRPWIEAEDAHRMVAGHLETAISFGERMGEGRFRRVVYEQLVGDDELVARELFAWLQIPFAPEVAELCRSQAEERTPYSGPTSRLSNAGERAAALEAWRRTLPDERLRESLAFLAPLLVHLGYETKRSLAELAATLPAAG